jgi:peptide chain release factor 1
MLDTHLLQQLRAIEQNYDALTAKLNTSNVLNHDDFIQIYGAINSIEEIVIKFRIWKKIQSDSIAIEQVLRDSDTDCELHDLANLEVLNLKQKSLEYERDLRILLLPKDPNDELNVILEVRALTGGDEAGIWAGELVRMYSRYAEMQNWKVFLLNESLAEMGGFKEAILEIKGDRVYSQLKFESGIHEIQHHSLTESTNKKLVTSMAAILVMPEVSEVEFYVHPDELEIQHFNYGFRGCPRPNPHGCTLYHKPTGIRIFCTEERSQRQNKERAMQTLRAKLSDIKLREQQEEVTSMRRSQVGTGSRSEKIRTYNYKDNRATDHRLGQNFGLEQVLSGDLENVIQSCISQDQQERLAELAASTGSN